MVNSYDFLNPMNQSIYLESMYPTNKQEVLQYMENYTPKQYGTPKLAPQPTKDSWYYNNDGVDDGKISFKEKLKAFFKGGTYNMIKGLFCDKDGFSIKRTLSSVAIGTAIGLTGPVGLAAAGAIGLLAGVGRFANASEEAKHASTDVQAREAYEGMGEGTSTTLLSLFGGFKGLKAIKNNFAFAKSHPNLKVGFLDRFLKWDASKYATVRPTKPNQPQKPDPAPAPSEPKTPSEPAPVVSETPVETPKPTPQRRVRRKKPTTSSTPKNKTKSDPIPEIPKPAIPHPKEWHGEKVDIKIPDTQVFTENTPSGTLPSPIGIPESQNWY